MKSLKMLSLIMLLALFAMSCDSGSEGMDTTVDSAEITNLVLVFGS